MFTLLALTVAAIAIIMFAMAIGVIMKRPCLRGSCGGPDILDPSGDPVRASRVNMNGVLSLLSDMTADPAASSLDTPPNPARYWRGHPAGRFAPSIEETIIGKVRELVKRVR